MGIVSISIFGLLALLPVAGQQAERGLILDRAGAAGQNAVAEFNAREMSRAYVDNNGNLIAPHWCVWNSANLFQVTAGQSYCLDPMYVTRVGNNPFPDVTGVNQMQRLNLRSRRWPPVSPIVPFGGPQPSTPSPYPAMTRAMAEYVFTAPDDLIFEENTDQANPTDATAPLLPIQQMGGANSMRQTEGAFSWMATLSPVFPQTSPSYVLSIVVFHNRDLAAGQERVVQVRQPDASGQPFTGVGGGDMQIAPRSSRPNTDTEIRKGQWVVLTPSSAVSYFRWYRAIDADFEGDASGARYITLNGEDWPTNPQGPQWAFLNATQKAGFNAPLCIIPSNVVAVYSRTIQLGEPSILTD